MENYMFIDGKKIPLSEETAKEIKKAFTPEESINTYEDVVEKLFPKGQSYYCTNSFGATCEKNRQSESPIRVTIGNETKTKKQLKSLLALNKLMNTAKVLNDGWLPDWKSNEVKYIIRQDKEELGVSHYLSTKTGAVCFKTEKLARKAIEILGEKTIRKALTLNH